MNNNEYKHTGKLNLNDFLKTLDHRKKITVIDYETNEILESKMEISKILLCKMNLIFCKVRTVCTIKGDVYITIDYPKMDKEGE